MHHLRKLITLGTVLVAIGGSAAVAQPTAPGGAFMRGPGPGGMGPGMMGRGPGSWFQDADAAGYLNRLKLNLAITAAQEDAWNSYAEIVRTGATQMQGVHQTMFDAMGTATWQERRDMMNRMFETRQQTFDAVHGAAEKLLPALSPEQRTKAASTLPGLATRGPGPGRGPGMMGSGMMGR